MNAHDMNDTVEWGSDNPEKVYRVGVNMDSDQRIKILREARYIVMSESDPKKWRGVIRMLCESVEELTEKMDKPEKRPDTNGLD